jgi:tetratricopeptide (TPR) repeat protein
MCRTRFFRLLVALALGAVASVGQADSIKLTSGKVLEGTIVSESDSGVQISTGGVVLTIPRSRIAAITRATVEATTDTAGAVERLGDLEAKALWPDLYEAATAILSRDTSNTAAAQKQKLAADKVRESLGMKQIADLVRQRKFDEAITSLTEQIHRSGLGSRGAGAVGRRALAELCLGAAEYRMRMSLDGHAPLADARKARELDPTTPGLDYFEGMAQMKLHNFDQAIELLERAARADPRNFGICIQLMDGYRQKGDFVKTVLLCEAALAETSASVEQWPEVRATVVEAYLQMALQLAGQRKTAQAAAAYEKCLRFSDRTPEQLRDASVFFERIGDLERARTVRSEKPRPRPVETRPTSATISVTGPRR